MTAIPPYVSTTNACNMCSPLGAALAFRGVENAIPFLHGSQGCATYMRRYIISHYREPVDIASSALGEKNAVYGGGPNLKKGILNCMQKYGAEVVGIATTCLTETIGDDVHMLLNEFRKEFSDLPLPELVQISTPSYSGTHMDGWHGAVRALAEQLVTEKAEANWSVNLMPGLTSCADLRHLKEICSAFAMPCTLLPDISETMEGVALEDYEKIPRGGTTLSAIKSMSGARASMEFGRLLDGAKTAGSSLEKRFQVPNHILGLPVGLRESDTFFTAMEEISGQPIPDKYLEQRGRLLDAMVDGHKYLAGKKAVVYGEEDFVIAMTSFLAEIGVHPVLVATGGKHKHFESAMEAVCGDLLPAMPVMRQDADFYDIAEKADQLQPDLLVGHSKGYKYARKANIPLIRVGFPIHDRFGGQRILHLGYEGALALFDRIVNAILEHNQNTNPVGYGYL
jgi:nitrogenase molybdenum-iron protein NifN